MHKYDERKSLAPRDIVARAIDNEMKIRGDEYVYLDCRHLEMEGFKKHFPNIYDKCLEEGIDVATQMIPVVPACHYFCGGILVDKIGKTSINRLYAAGECTASGLHGANRLASNSLLEGLVYGHNIAVDAVSYTHLKSHVLGLEPNFTFLQIYSVSHTPVQLPCPMKNTCCVHDPR